MVKKHILDCTNDLWKRVMIYKVQGGFANVNDALVDLLEKALLGNYEELRKKGGKTHALTDKHKERLKEEINRKFT